MYRIRKTIDEIKVGDYYTLSKRFSAKRVNEFSRLTCDTNPFHLSVSSARKRGFKKKIVHGLLIASIGSEIASQHFPGPGTILVELDIRFIRPLFVGEEIKVTTMVIKKDLKRKRIISKSVGKKRNGKIVFRSLEVMIPPV